MFGTTLLPDVTVPLIAPSPLGGIELDVDVLLVVRGAAEAPLAATIPATCSTMAADPTNNRREARSRCRRPTISAVIAATPHGRSRWTSIATSPDHVPWPGRIIRSMVRSGPCSCGRLTRGERAGGPQKV